MGKFRLLPWEYGVRNLFRRPSRTLLTLMGLTLVVLLVLVVVGFIRGLETSLAVSGDPRVVLVHAPGGSENVENSTIAGRTAPVLASARAAQTAARDRHDYPVHLKAELADAQAALARLESDLVNLPA
jgi:putative ABC transport system permease protein